MPKVIKEKRYKSRKNIYSRQPTDITCGPTALYNLIKWSGSDIPTNLTFRKLHKMCDTKEPFGTYFKDFNNTLKIIEKNINIKVIDIKTSTTINEITEHLKNYGSILIEYHWKDIINGKIDEGQHYIFVDKISNTKFNIVNDEDYNIEKLVDKRKMKEILFKKEFIPPKYDDPMDNIYPKVWFVKKID